MVEDTHRFKLFEALASLIVPILVCDLLIGTIEDSLEEFAISHEVPVSVLIELSA
jgi:hypothetical protein